ncbi:MAG: hypothetical protein ACP5O6_12415, partial [Candidatus Baltobacteraceae bacterium]
MNRSSAAKTVPSLIAWKIQPSDSGALSAFLATAGARSFPPGTTLKTLSDGLVLTWDPERTPSGAVRTVALAVAAAHGCSLRGSLLAPLDDRARAAIGRELLAEPR